MADKRRFTVIENKNYTVEEKIEKVQKHRFQTDPIHLQGQTLREQFAKYVNDEGGARFSIDDLLKW